MSEILKNIKGSRKLKPEDLEEYMRKMETEVIPSIVEVIYKRQVAAAKSRHRILRNNQ